MFNISYVLLAFCVSHILTIVFMYFQVSHLFDEQCGAYDCFIHLEPL